MSRHATYEEVVAKLKELFGEEFDCTTDCGTKPLFPKFERADITLTRVAGTYVLCYDVPGEEGQMYVTILGVAFVNEEDTYLTHHLEYDGQEIGTICIERATTQEEWKLVDVPFRIDDVEDEEGGEE